MDENVFDENLLLDWECCILPVIGNYVTREDEKTENISITK